MLIMMINGIILFFMSLVFFLYSLYFYYFNNLILMEWMFCYFNSLELEMLLLMDWISLLFMSLVSVISSMVFFYSMNYMKYDNYNNRFGYLLMLFIFSMYFMIISPNIMSIMIGWDGLGLISFCLVIFYQNFSSFKSGMITVLCNRLGDIGLLMSIGFSFMFGSWNLFLYNNNYIIIFIILASISKSAMMPFSIWLPAAMAAPTPVSSLVHSSTLVTAGVYMLIRYNDMLMFSDYFNLLMLISLFTLIMSSIMALFEYDLKKIIALSTLSQLSIMMISLCLGLKELAYFHLIVHALFKSLLFLCSGLLIHSMNNNQDIRFYGNLYKNYPITSMMFLCSSFSLSGFPFLSGFYSKDLIIENVSFISVFYVWMVLFLASIFTFSYNLRLFYYLFLNKSNYCSCNLNIDNMMLFSMVLLYLYSIFGGSMLYWIFFINVKLSFFCHQMKLLLLLIFIMGFFFFYNIVMKKYKKSDLLIYISSMFFMLYMYNMYYNIFIMSKQLNKFFEKGWVEMSFKGIMLNMIIKKWNNFFNIIMLMMMFIYMNLIIIIMMI